MKILKTVVAAAVATTVTLGAVAPMPEARAQWTGWTMPQPGPVTAKQGGEFTFFVPAGLGSCTIAYNDSARRVSHTAAHCGREGDKVYLKDSRGRLVEAGTFHPSKNFDQGTFMQESTATNDWAIIKWNDQVIIGPNELSGDRIIPLDELNRGDRVCLHGARTGSTQCGEFAGYKHSMFFTAGIASQKGDSGGPVFVPGRGIVGVHSGTLSYKNQLGEPRHAGRASVMETDGKRVRNSQHIEVVRKYHGDSEIFTWNGIPIPVDGKLSSEMSSKLGLDDVMENSELTVGEIITIVISILSIASAVAGVAQRFL